jgi:hypothetical protein
MTYQRYIKGIIYITVVAWAILLLIDHQAVTSTFFRPLSTVTSFTLCFVIAFDLWFWKLPMFRGWLVKRPVIEGATGLPGEFCTSCNDRNWIERSCVWHEGRSMEPNRW